MEPVIHTLLAVLAIIVGIVGFVVGILAAEDGPEGLLLWIPTALIVACLVWFQQMIPWVVAAGAVAGLGYTVYVYAPNQREARAVRRLRHQVEHERERQKLQAQMEALRAAEEERLRSLLD